MNIQKIKHVIVPGIIVLTLCLCFSGVRHPSLASSGDNLELVAVPIASVAVVSLVGYALWKNRLSQPPDAVGKLGYRGPGEFYLGGFLGASLIENTDWRFKGIVGGGNATGRNVGFDPGLVGGIKVGYFFDNIPYLGLEAEGSLGSNNQSRQTVNLSPPVAGVPTAILRNQNVLAWTMALHFIGRYGFLPDKEVPFGRLQPYVGIGPGLVMLYFEADSAKNFSLEALAGLRYMLTKNLATFVEYKFSKQWDVELDDQFIVTNGLVRMNTSYFDFNNHKVVLGLSYHF